MHVFLIFLCSYLLYQGKLIIVYDDFIFFWIFLLLIELWQTQCQNRTLHTNWKWQCSTQTCIERLFSVSITCRHLAWTLAYNTKKSPSPDLVWCWHFLTGWTCMSENVKKKCWNYVTVKIFEALCPLVYRIIMFQG